MMACGIYALSMWGVRFEVFMVVAIKNAVFWDVTQCDSCKNWHLVGMSGWQEPVN
jgi:hypothetical protein